jgi:hypothetical protein
MSLALSERNVSFVPFYKSSCYIKEINDIMKITNSLTETVHELNARIEGLCSNSNININVRPSV